MAQVSAKKLEHTGAAEQERLVLASIRAIRANYNIVRREKVMVGKNCILTKNVRARHTVKSKLHAEGREVPGREGRHPQRELPPLPGEGRQKHERICGRKDSPRGPGKSRFHSKSNQAGDATDG